MPPVKARAKKTSPRRRRGKRKPQTLTERVGSVLAEATSNIASLFVLSLLGLVAVVFIMMLAGGYFANPGERIGLLTEKISRAVGLDVTRVSLEGGEYIAHRDIMGALRDPVRGSILGRSVLHVDLPAARARVEEIGWVEHAAVQRLLPNTVHVSITERQADALWQNEAGEYYVVDRTGRVLSAVSPTAHTDLPVIAGTDRPAAASPLLDALAQFPELRARVAVILSVGDRRFDLRFRNDFTARLPGGDPIPALEKLEGLGAGSGRLAERLEYIDLRDADWAAVKPKTGL
ncbi:cell division protein FtsQ [Parvularcula bermudensis HTCC2503]|uniref:Cell division protein FtsQ n=1 Tax=Parvularcula bermudensis (strain ATCC BAA-594 / HTCC2503 / KCTC 12087) TaxID=314260 RepID=E0TDT5_PARBH|nr:cell division protein FtsQ/DivIB [Parvularcula bermudensis]ADM10001.1 cell division protein FtsQ [Parvularcula bermudensis HTCC2503]